MTTKSSKDWFHFQKDEKSDTRKKQNPHDDFGSLVAAPLNFLKKSRSHIGPKQVIGSSTKYLLVGKGEPAPTFTFLSEAC
jgi:hypothetical protein